MTPTTLRLQIVTADAALDPDDDGCWVSLGLGPGDRVEITQPLGPGRRLVTVFTVARNGRLDRPGDRT